MKAYKRIFKESDQTFDVTQTQGLNKQQIEALIDKAWPDDVLYNGKPIFEPYLDIVRVIDAVLEKKIFNQPSTGDEDDDDFSYYGQECYLGYVPSKDIFICGFDVDDGNAPTNAIANLTFDDRMFQLINVEFYLGNAKYFYSGNNSAYDFLHKKYHDLIDLRLD